MVSAIEAEAETVFVEEENYGGREWGCRVINYRYGGKNAGVKAETSEDVIEGRAESCLEEGEEWLAREGRKNEGGDVYLESLELC